MTNKITKTIFSGLILACASTTVSAQTVNKFGDRSMTIEPTAVLELESTTKGFLAPRMTAVQKNAISSPAEGLLVYQTDGTKGFYSFIGTAWVLSTTGGNLSLAEANLFVGNGSNIASAVALGGDATIDKTGSLSIVDGKITNDKLNKTGIPLSGFAAAASDVAFGGFKLTGVAEPTVAQDAATKRYVDDAAAAINTLADGKVYIGDGFNVAQEVAFTGDVTIDNTGLLAIGASKVLTTMIADANVTTAKIVDSNITAVKIAENAITSSKIVDNSIATADIATSAVTEAVLASDAVVAVKIKDLNVTEAKIAANAVTYGKMQAMTANKLLGSGLTGTAVAELTLGTGLSFTGTTINAVSNNIANVITVSAATTLTVANNSVYTSTAMTLTLPVAAAGNTGLTFLIKKTDNDTTLTFSESIFTTATDSFTTLNYAKAIRIQSDGATWYLVN